MCVTRHEVPPLSDGLYYATPVLLADCSESEESDTDTDAQTVIHTSPYSSPGGSKDIKSFTDSHSRVRRKCRSHVFWSASKS